MCWTACECSLGACPLPLLHLNPTCTPWPHTLRPQAAQHERQVRQLEGALQDPAREAEVALLRDDCRYLKARRGLAEWLRRQAEQRDACTHVLSKPH